MAEPGGTGPLDGKLAALAKQWAGEILPTSHISLARGAAEDLLHGLLRDLLTALTAEPFQAAPGVAIGQRLVAGNFTGINALNHSLRVIGKHLLDSAGLPFERRWHDRLTDLTGELSAGYVDALRERLFDEQELLKRAVFRARDVAEKARKASEARFRAVFNSSAVGIAMIDLDGQIQLANPALAEILGYTGEDLLQHTIGSLLTESDAAKVVAAFNLIAAGEQGRFLGNVDFIGRDEQPRWTLLSLSLVQQDSGEPDYAVAIIEDISDLHLLRENQMLHSLVDRLTGLPNHNQFMSLLDMTLASAEPGARVALCYVDLDGFKIINDGIGHAIGDEVLKRVAGVLEKTFPGKNATVARMGGDGFAVLVSGTRRSLEISEHITDALAELAEPVYYDHEYGVAVSASVGIVEGEVEGLTAEDLVRAAELTVHRAKNDGKAQWVLFDRHEHERERAGFQLAAAIPGALENGEFVVSYQPVRTIADGTLAGLRAVLHWQHPRLGALPPEEFLALAEETGFIVPIGRWMLEEVCGQLGYWRERFGERTPPVLVGLTGRLAKEQDLIKIITELTDRLGIGPELLRLGIPSSVVVDRWGEPLENLDALQDLDIRTMVDEFGTSNAGLVDLRTLPIHGVSVAASVIRAYADGQDPDSPFEQVLRQIVRLAGDRNMRVLADGVDTVDLANRLGALGVQLGYGPAFGQPVPPERIEEDLGRIG